MRTIDLRKKLKPLYAASARTPAILEVPAMGCIMVDGKGEPGGTAFQEAVGTLYSVAYTMKFRFKKEKSIDYPVMALEGLWHSDSMDHFLSQKREDWTWTLFIALPDVVTKKDVSQPSRRSGRKGSSRGFPRCGSKNSRRAARPRSCTWDPTQRNGRPSTGFTRSCAGRATSREAHTTRSISVTPGGPGRKR